jgi:hypothetical protein
MCTNFFCSAADFVSARYILTVFVARVRDSVPVGDAREAQIDALTDVAIGVVKWSGLHYIYRAGKSARYNIARRNNYRFLQLQDTALDRASAGGEYILTRKI